MTSKDNFSGRVCYRLWACYEDEYEHEHSDLLGEYDTLDDALAATDLLGATTTSYWTEVHTNEGNKMEKFYKTLLPDGREVILSHQVEVYQEPLWRTVTQISPGDPYWMDENRRMQ